MNYLILVSKEEPKNEKLFQFLSLIVKIVWIKWRIFDSLMFFVVESNKNLSLIVNSWGLTSIQNKQLMRRMWDNYWQDWQQRHKHKSWVDYRLENSPKTNWFVLDVNQRIHHFLIETIFFDIISDVVFTHEKHVLNIFSQKYLTIDWRLQFQVNENNFHFSVHIFGEISNVFHLFLSQFLRIQNLFRYYFL